MRYVSILALGLAVVGCAKVEPDGSINLTPWYKPPANYTADPARPQREPTAEERAMIEEAVREAMKDPESAVIGERMMIAGTLGDEPALEIWVACGTVNAKNSYGGYTGRQGFIAAIMAAGDKKSARLMLTGGTAYEKERVEYLCGTSGIAL